jgi:hypothetical protein
VASCTCCGVVVCGGGCGAVLPPLPLPPPPFPDPPPPVFPCPPEWLVWVGDVELMAEVTSPVSARKPVTARPALVAVLPVAARPRPAVAARPAEALVEGAPSVMASEAGETYAGTIVAPLLCDFPPSCGSSSTCPVARVQRKMDAATPAPSSPRLAPRRIRPPTKGQITTVSWCSQTSIHKAATESVQRAFGRGQKGAANHCRLSVKGARG